MIVWVRNIVLILFVLTVVYIALSSLSRFRYRRKLIGNYKTEKPTISEDDFIDQGMAKYERSLKAKLFVGVYLFPLAVIMLLIYLAQYT